MATLLLQVAGAALGTALGGPAGGAIGQALGGLAGATIDQAWLGGAGGNKIVEGPRLKEVNGLAATEGAPIPRLYGRARLGGQLIWATRFEEEVTVSVTRSKSGGKGGRARKTYESTYSYYANLAKRTEQRARGQAARRGALLRVARGSSLRRQRPGPDRGGRRGRDRDCRAGRTRRHAALPPLRLRARPWRLGGGGFPPPAGRSPHRRPRRIGRDLDERSRRYRSGTPLPHRPGPPRCRRPHHGGTRSHAAGDALLPFSPVRPRARRGGDGILLNWIRRTRIDGDSWDLAEVPLGEESERYEIRLLAGGVPVRTEIVNAPAWLYPAAVELADFGATQAELSLSLAQISAAVGPGREWRGRIAVA